MKDLIVALVRKVPVVGSMIADLLGGGETQPQRRPSTQPARPAPQAAPKVDPKPAAKKPAAKSAATKSAAKPAAKKPAAKPAAKKKAAPKKKVAAKKVTAGDDGELSSKTRKELYSMAQDLDITGRKNMRKAELIEAIQAAKK